MAKRIYSGVLDGASDIIDQATLMTVCSAEPTTRTQAVTTYKLADVAMTPDTDFTKAAGDAGGQSRKVTVAAKSDVAIDTSGSATHIALVDGTNLLVVTTCNAATLESGTVDIPAWKIEFGTPT